jgi:hypothetical protein
MADQRFPARVPAKVPRLVAFQVVLLGLTFLVSGSFWPLAFLACDFAMRAVVAPRFSPLALVARRVAPLLPGGAGLPISFSPKRFAAMLGFVFLTGALVLNLIPDMVLGGKIVTGIVVVLASLEASAGVCVGCHIHALLVRHGVLKVPVCETCVPVAVGARAGSSCFQSN